MSHSVPTEKTNVPSSSALWAVLIFIGLILAAVNFIKAENSGEGHGEHAAATEQVENDAHSGATKTVLPEQITPQAKPAAAAAEGAQNNASQPAANDTTKHAAEEAHH
jgi:hypothetical protein